METEIKITSWMKTSYLICGSQLKKKKKDGPLFRIHDQFQVGNSRALGQTIDSKALSQAWTPS